LTLVVLFFFHWALITNRPKSSFSTPWILTDPELPSKVIGNPNEFENVTEELDNVTVELDSANACFVVLIRNSDLHSFRPTMRQLEDRFNHKYNYPYVFLNDVPFTEEFKKYTSALTKAKTEYGLIQPEQWSVPDHIDMDVVRQNMKQMEREGVLYGDKYDYYWRVEPGVQFFCDIDFDPFVYIRDKLDLVKGVIQKLHAFEKFLSEYPEWQNKRRVAELIAQINGTYGSLEYTPVHHLHSLIEQDEYFALLSIADIGLITSVRDGMNTTSLEYIMCQQENYGPLILSEFTGMAGSLGAAIMVNPWDYSGVAKAINDALTMSNEEKQNKHLQLYRHVTIHTAQFWAKSFIKELVQCLTSSNQTNTTPSLDVQSLLTKYKQSKNRLLLFDYDGTLTPIVKTPSQAVPPPEMLEALQKLTEDPKNTVWIVSGRGQNVLEEWLGSIKKLGFSAEHGCFLKYPESDKWSNLTEDIDMSWYTDVEEIFTYFTERTQGSSIEQILLGKKNLEVRPTLINKGEIVKRLLTGMQEVDFVFCAGDDRTDEDMFRVLKRTPDFNDLECFTVTIGPPTKKTLASWHVSSPEE
ncbi:16774_t:CDS:2, partial [Gigaspora rosea]